MGEEVENDLKAATRTMKLARGCPTDTVCFHAQQCVEKYLKSVLVMQQIEFSKTHDLRILMERIPSTIRIEFNASEQDRLTRYAVATCYPGEDEPITMPEAREAVRMARRVRAQIRKLLPKAALRP